MHILRVILFQLVYAAKYIYIYIYIYVYVYMYICWTCSVWAAPALPFFLHILNGRLSSMLQRVLKIWIPTFKKRQLRAVLHYPIEHSNLYSNFLNSNFFVEKSPLPRTPTHNGTASCNVVLLRT